MIHANLVYAQNSKAMMVNIFLKLGLEDVRLYFMQTLTTCVLENYTSVNLVLLYVYYT